jgi:O-antigen/teichoic acid export membrane protein
MYHPTAVAPRRGIIRHRVTATCSVMQDSDRASTFSGRVVALFTTQVFGALAGILNGILLARFLGPAGKGDYYLLLLVPSTAIVLVQLGLPQAVSFYTARGRTAGIMSRTLVLTVALSVGALLAVALLLPFLQDAILHGISLDQFMVALVALPIAVSATFTTAIIMGRRAVRWYSGINIAYPIGTGLLLVVLALLGPSVMGALVVYLIAITMRAIALAIGARRVSADNVGAESVSYRELVRYGLRVYPASLTGFFIYRVDAYLIAFLLVAPAVQLGYYSMAVGLAEMVFFFPNAVSNLFFPHVAASPREESDRHVAMVSRVTLLVTGAFALALIPAAAVMIWVVLPDFGPALPALIVLLPGVVALSLAKVVGAFVVGVGRPEIDSYVSVGAVIVNIIANLILIPRLGIVGAAAASLISYSLTSFLLTLAAARFTTTSVADFWVPRGSDVRLIVAASLGLVRRLRESRAAARQKGGVRT